MSGLLYAAAARYAASRLTTGDGRPGCAKATNFALSQFEKTSYSELAQRFLATT